MLEVWALQARGVILMTFTVTWAHIHSIIGWIYAIMVWASFAHDFSIDLSGKHMPTKSYQKYVHTNEIQQCCSI